VLSWELKWPCNSSSTMCRSSSRVGSLDEAIKRHRHHQDDLSHRGSLRSRRVRGSTADRTGSPNPIGDRDCVTGRVWVPPLREDLVRPRTDHRRAAARVIVQHPRQARKPAVSTWDPAMDRNRRSALIGSQRKSSRVLQVLCGAVACEDRLSLWFRVHLGEVDEDHGCRQRGLSQLRGRQSGCHPGQLARPGGNDGLNRPPGRLIWPHLGHKVKISSGQRKGKRALTRRGSRQNEALFGRADPLKRRARFGATPTRW
jgi:hypothetical protein